MYGTKYFDENFLGKSQIMGNAQYYTSNSIVRESCIPLPSAVPCIDGYR
jgi:hypothetical protein